MSTALVKAEIRRFLTSTDPEVLCIKGKWGVGKTFAWMEFLNEVCREKKLGLNKYAYVSLFGLNSLSDLKYSIFESTVPQGQIISGPNIESLRDALESAGTLSRKARPLAGPLLNAIGIKDAGEALSKAAFLSVRNQFVCIDDIERAGSTLEIRDVLGLASMLKEQRRCKVVLLLNDEQLSKKKKEAFERLLEKVIDVSLTFEPTSEEAIEIAFSQKTVVNQSLEKTILKLDITNIRIIKKIERQANRLAELLADFRSEVFGQAMMTVTLAGWCVYAPDESPSSTYLKHYNRDVEARRVEQDGDENQVWVETLHSVGYLLSDELDVAIVEGVERGYFEEQAVLESAKQIQHLIENDNRKNSFTRAWDGYRDSLTLDDDTILDGLFNGAIENLTHIRPGSVNATVIMLRENGRNEQANQLVVAYMTENKFARGVLENEFRIWGNDPIDPELESEFKRIDDEFVDSRDPANVLCTIAENSSWNEEDIDLLAGLSAEDFERIFEGIEGPHLYQTAKFAVRLGKNDGENYKAMGQAVEEGLKRIAAKSRLRADRVKLFGVKLD